MALSTAARFPSVTPVIPTRAKAAGVNAGEALRPAAVSKMPFTTSAIASSSACVSTFSRLEVSRTSFIRLAF